MRILRQLLVWESVENGFVRAFQQQFSRAKSGSNKVSVILQQDVPNLGSKGNIATVKAGYFRNFLYPQKMAIYATKSNVEKLEKSVLEAARARDEQRRAEAIRQRQLAIIAQRLTSSTIEVKQRIVEGTSTLYGSVTARSICEAVGRQLKIDLPEARVLLPEPIREAGTHRVPLAISAAGGGAAGAEVFMTVAVRDAAEAPKKGPSSKGDGAVGAAAEGEDGSAGPGMVRDSSEEWLG